MKYISYNSNNDFGTTYNNTDLFTLTIPKETSSKSYIDTLLDKAYKGISWLKPKNEEIKLINLGDLFNYSKPLYTLMDVSPLALNLEWNKATTNLYNLLTYLNDPIYDFKIGGIPVKVFGNYIQVGSKILPKYATSNDFMSFGKEERTVIYNISLEINSMSFAA